MVTYRSRYSKFLHKQHKQALKRKEREERFREKQKKKKTKEIEQKISLGDKLVSENQLKNAFHLYSNAKDIATNYNKSLVFCCEEKKKFIRNIVNQNVNNKLESTMQEIDRLFLAEQFTEIEPITRNYFNYLKKFKWVQIDGKFDELLRRQ